MLRLTEMLYISVDIVIPSVSIAPLTRTRLRLQSCDYNYKGYHSAVSREEQDMLL